MAKAHRQIITNVTFRSMMAVEMWGEDVLVPLYSLLTHTCTHTHYVWIPVYQPFPPVLTQPVTHCACLECIQHTAGAVKEWACNNGKESAVKLFITSCIYSSSQCQAEQEKKDQTRERLQNKKKIDSWRWNESQRWSGCSMMAKVRGLKTDAMLAVPPIGRVVFFCKCIITLLYVVNIANVSYLYRFRMY